MSQKPVVSQYTYVYILKLNFDVIIRTFLVVKNEEERKKNINVNLQDCLEAVVKKTITRVDSRNDATSKLTKVSKGIWKVVFTENVDCSLEFESSTFYNSFEIKEFSEKVVGNSKFIEQYTTTTKCSSMIDTKIKISSYTPKESPNKTTQ